MTQREQRIRERAYELWELEGRRHEDDLAPLRVTFDTNTLNSVVWPETAQRGTGTSGAEIHAAIKAGRISGFICGSMPSMEGVNKRDRVEFLSKQPIRPRVMADDPDRAVVMAPDQSTRPALSDQFQERLEAAAQLGIRVIKIPTYTEFELPPSFVAQEPANFDAKFARVYSALKQRGVGRASLEDLGLEFAIKKVVRAVFRSVRFRIFPTRLTNRRR